MDRLDYMIQNILKEEADVPDIVNDKMNAAFSRIMAERKSEETVIKLKHRYSRKRVAAIALLVVMGVSTTVFAAGKYVNLADYFSQHGQDMSEQAAKMIDKNVVQENKEGELVNFKVREAVCDSEQIFAVIEAKPVDPDKYFILGQGYWEDELVQNLGIAGAEGKTIGEYAGDKEILQTGVYIESGAETLAVDFKMEEDGTGVFIVSSENVTGNTEMNFQCIATVVPPDSNGSVEDVIRNEFSFTMQDISSSEIMVYQPKENLSVGKSGVMINKIDFTKTELGLYGEVSYSIVDGQSEASEHIAFKILDENGIELKSGIGLNSGHKQVSEGVYEVKYCYSLTELPDTIMMEVFEYSTGEQFGTVELQLVK